MVKVKISIGMALIISVIVDSQDALKQATNLMLDAVGDALHPDKTTDMSELANIGLDKKQGERIRQMPVVERLKITEMCIHFLYIKPTTKLRIIRRYASYILQAFLDRGVTSVTIEVEDNNQVKRTGHLLEIERRYDCRLEIIAQSGDQKVPIFYRPHHDIYYIGNWNNWELKVIPEEFLKAVEAAQRLPQK